MRRLIYILLFIPFALYGQTTYYIHTTGSNVSGNGSIGNPWATLAYAASQVTTTGDTIRVIDGVYTETTRCLPAEGVSIVGTGAEINYTYSSITYSNGCISLVSAAEGTNGNQIIKGLKITGSSQAAYHGIFIKCRSNVTLENLTVEDFLYNGIHFQGQDDRKDEPVIYATGNKLINCVIDNCCNKEYDYYSYGTGQVRVTGQDGIIIAYNTISNMTAPEGYRGDNIDFRDGFNKNMNIHHNKSYKPYTNGAAWHLHFESWGGMGGNHVHHNEFHGGGIQLDIAGLNEKGDSEYSWLIEHNKFLAEEQISYSGSRSYRPGIVIEGNTSDVIVRYNYFKHVPKGIGINAAEYSNPTRLYNIVNVYIYYNVLEDIGYTDYTSYAMEASSESVNVYMENINIFNNTIVAKSAYRAGAGLHFISQCPINGINFIDNIVIGMTLGPIYRHANNTGTITDFSNQNNVFYGNGNNNDLRSNTATPIVNYVESGIIKSDPLFEGVDDFRLQSGSPAINAGINVGLDKDFRGWPIVGLPDIGAYEYGATAPAAGGMLKDASGVLLRSVEGTLMRFEGVVEGVDTPEPDPEPEPEVFQRLGVAAQSVDHGSEEMFVKVDLCSDVEWVATSNEDWLKVATQLYSATFQAGIESRFLSIFYSGLAPDIGYAEYLDVMVAGHDSAFLYLIAEENTGEERTAIVTITSDDIEGVSQIAVTQAAGAIVSREGILERRLYINRHTRELVVRNE